MLTRQPHSGYWGIERPSPNSRLHCRYMKKVRKLQHFRSLQGVHRLSLEQTENPFHHHDHSKFESMCSLNGFIINYAQENRIPKYQIVCLIGKHTIFGRSPALSRPDWSGKTQVSSPSVSDGVIVCSEVKF